MVASIVHVFWVLLLLGIRMRRVQVPLRPNFLHVSRYTFTQLIGKNTKIYIFCFFLQKAFSDIRQKWNNSFFLKIMKNWEKMIPKKKIKNPLQKYNCRYFNTFRLLEISFLRSQSFYVVEIISSSKSVWNISFTDPQIEKNEKSFCHWNSFTLKLRFFPKIQSFNLSSRFQSYFFFPYEFFSFQKSFIFSWHQSPDRLQTPKSATNIGLTRYWKETFRLDIFHQGLDWKFCSRTGVFDWIIINFIPSSWIFIQQ